MYEKKLMWLLPLGNFLTVLCYSLYTSFSSSIQHLFFPSGAEIFAQFGPLIAFTIGLLGCPLGGLIFGHISDTKGTLKTLKLALALMALSTLAIGILPTYNQIGWASSCLLIFFLILQGMCIGGEYNTACILLSEHCDYLSENKCAERTSTIPAAGIGGWCISLTLMLISPRFEGSYEFWRLAFIICSVIATFPLFIWRGIHLDREIKNRERFPFFKLATEYPGSMLAVYFVGTLAGVLFFGQFVFSMAFLPRVFGVHSSIAMLCGVGGMGLCALVTPLMGKVADHFGRIRLMLFSSIATALLAVPISSLVTYADNTMIAIAHIFGALLTGAFIAPASVLCSEVFPKSLRTTGYSFPYHLGGNTLGALTPFVSTFLIHQTGAVTAPASYLTFCAVLGIAAAFIFSHALGERKEVGDL